MKPSMTQAALRKAFPNATSHFLTLNAAGTEKVSPALVTRPGRDVVGPGRRKKGIVATAAVGKRLKYGNRKAEWDGIVFDSEHERDRYLVLADEEKHRGLFGLCVHVPVPVEPEGCEPIIYEIDFLYFDTTFKPVVEDAKSAATRLNAVYRLKKKLFESRYGLKITEV